MATPRATCGPGSRPETGLQGRVSPEDHVSGRAAEGFTCNTELVGSYTEPDGQGTYGGFKVERYVDAHGQECAFYDTTLLFPTDLLDGMAGVNVMDMSDPTAAPPTEPAMPSPAEPTTTSPAGVAGTLPATGGEIPRVFVVTTAIGALLLVWAVRGTWVSDCG